MLVPVMDTDSSCSFNSSTPVAMVEGAYFFNDYTVVTIMLASVSNSGLRQSPSLQSTKPANPLL